MKKIAYSEPASYFPKSVLKDIKKNSGTGKKTAATKKKVKRK